MNHQEAMMNELDRILEELKKLDPTTEKYKIGMACYHELMTAFHEELEACESDLDHSLKREVEKERLVLSKKEERNHRIQIIVEAIVGLLKIGLTIAGTLIGVVLTTSLEETTILSQKGFNWILRLTPKI